MKNTKNTKKIISITLALAILVIIIYLINQYTELFWGFHSVPQYFKSSCVGVDTFTCAGNLTINRLGELSFGLNNNLNGTLYNIAFSCIGMYITPNAAPKYVNFGATPNSSTFYSLGSNGSIGALNNNGISISRNQTTMVKNLQCFLPNQTAINNLTKGSQFIGYIWISYTKNSTAPTNQSGSNPRYISRIIVVEMAEGT